MESAGKGIAGLAGLTMLQPISGLAQLAGISQSPYSVEDIITPQGAVEHRFLHGARHFLTIIDDHGTFNSLTQ